MVLKIICIIAMSASFFFVFFAMIGYPFFLLMINKIKKPNKIIKDYTYEPYVSYMIVAHNEEKCIKAKLDNILTFDYPLDKIQILVASDFCTDRTDEIVELFKIQHPELKIVLNKSKEHKGKTNAQNETQKYATGEILVMTDANSIFKNDAIRELVSSFVNEDILYVCGQLKYVNDDNYTAANESIYWRLDLKQREIESNIQTITAGNGSIYAVRNDAYIDIDPINCHDGYFPRFFALHKKRSLYNPQAISYEKAGENNRDEFKRKIRMNRNILDAFVNMWRPMNFFKYKWFSVFFFGHRTCRYLLWFNHLILLISSFAFLFSGSYISGGIIVGFQIVAFLFGLVAIVSKTKIKPFRLLGYYLVMLFAQIVAAFKQMIGKSKPVWEKADSTR